MFDLLNICTLSAFIYLCLLCFVYGLFGGAIIRCIPVACPELTSSRFDMRNISYDTQEE